MKRWILLLAVALLFLSGCSRDDLRINGHDWQFSSAQSRINGEVVAEAPEQMVEATATAKELTLKVGEKEYVFPYSDPRYDPKTVVYSLGEGRTALVGITTFYDGEKEYEKYTLILSLKEYNLTFYAEK